MKIIINISIKTSNIINKNMIMIELVGVSLILRAQDGVFSLIVTLNFSFEFVLLKNGLISRQRLGLFHF